MREFEMIIHYERIGESDMFNCHEVGELVRCKDCKHFNALDKSRAWDCPVGLLDCMADDFCSRGQRKEVMEE